MVIIFLVLQYKGEVSSEHEDEELDFEAFAKFCKENPIEEGSDSDEEDDDEESGDGGSDEYGDEESGDDDSDEDGDEVDDVGLKEID